METPFYTFTIHGGAPKKIRRQQIICRFVCSDDIHWIMTGPKNITKNDLDWTENNFVDSYYWKAYWKKHPVEEIDIYSLPPEAQEKIFEVWPWFNPIQLTNQYTPQAQAKLEIEAYCRTIGEDQEGFDYYHPKYNPRRSDGWINVERRLYHAAGNNLAKRTHYGD